MSFLIEEEPEYGKSSEVAPYVQRIVAENPSVMTYHGTNTYLIDGPSGTIVLDPGPDSAEHVAAILSATGGQIAKILLTHRHSDHVGALDALKAATDAPSYAFELDDVAFRPDYGLRDGDVVDGLRVIHTPGHAADHICLAREEDALLFSGDHVMSWSSSVVSPPGGDMAAYFSSLTLLLERDDRLYLPGHGPALHEPLDFVRGLLSHRQARERELWLALRQGPMRVTDLVDRLYHKQHPRLHHAATRNVTAHLLKLQAEGRVFASLDGIWTVTADDEGVLK